MMSDFRTQYQRQRVFCDSGNAVVKMHELRYDEDGNEYFEVIGEKDLYDEIQSHKLSVDINYILARFASGDKDVLSKKQGIYGDFSSFPRSYAEMLNTLNSAQSVFDQLPVEIKNKFGDSMQAWLTQYGTPSWAEKMGFSQKVEGMVVNSDAVKNDAYDNEGSVSE